MSVHHLWGEDPIAGVNVPMHFQVIMSLRSSHCSLFMKTTTSVTSSRATFDGNHGRDLPECGFLDIKKGQL